MADFVFEHIDHNNGTGLRTGSPVGFRRLRAPRNDGHHRSASFKCFFPKTPEQPITVRPFEHVLAVGRK